MIEKFTEEELKIIIKELKELPKDKAKREWCKDEIKRLYSAYQNNEVSGAPHPYDITGQILAVVDYFMGNFSPCANNRKNYKGKNTRYCHIRSDIADEYRECFSEIVDVLTRHSKKYKGEEE